MVTHYTSKSRGPVPIASMAYPHAINARDALVRLNAEDRQAELDALNQRIAEMDAEIEETTNG